MMWEHAALGWLNGRTDRKWFAKDQGYVERLMPYFEGFTLAEITEAKIAVTRDQLLKKHAAATVNRYMGVVRSILVHSRERGLLDVTPRVRKIAERERMRFITPEQAVSLIEHLPPNLKPMVRFVLATGLRSSNVRNLEWTEVSIERQWGSIPGDKMKNGSPFGFPLNADAIQVLAEQKGKHPRWVFPVKYAGKVGPMVSIAQKGWDRACKSAGIVDFHFHDLRHTWASWHAQQGTSELALQELGSWKDPKMVKRYAHLAARHLSAAASNIGGLCNISPEPPSRNASPSARNRRVA